MTALLIGSRALRYWYSDARQPHDYDLLIDSNTLHNWMDDNHPHFSQVREPRLGKTVCRMRVGIQIEFETDEHPSAAMLLDYSRAMPTINIFGIEANIASPEVLMTIKRSHLHWPLNWQTHIEDYTFIKNKNITLTDELSEILKIRKKERDARERKSVGSLMMSNDEFFAKSESAVKRRFVHDHLHEAIKYYDEPLYAKAKNDKSLAILEKELFFGFKRLDQLRLVREEAYVIALERVIIPRLFNRIALYRCNAIGIDEVEIPTNMIQAAYSHALQRICTTLTKGWFRDFAIENYQSLLKPEIDYYAKFSAAVINGTLVEAR